jgi:hypothetical protein
MSTAQLAPRCSEATGTTLYRPIVAADAVHSMYILDSTGLIAALKNGVR